MPISMISRPVTDSQTLIEWLRTSVGRRIAVREPQNLAQPPTAGNEAQPFSFPVALLLLQFRDSNSGAATTALMIDGAQPAAPTGIEIPAVDGCCPFANVDGVQVVVSRRFTGCDLLRSTGPGQEHIAHAYRGPAPWPNALLPAQLRTAFQNAIHTQTPPEGFPTTGLLNILGSILMIGVRVQGGRQWFRLTLTAAAAFDAAEAHAARTLSVPGIGAGNNHLPGSYIHEIVELQANDWT